MNQRIWLVLVAPVAALLLVLVLGLSYLRARVAASRLPERARTIESLPGCPAAVDILIDDRGYPHVYSGSDSALWFAQGYLHARERFFQMDLARRMANGRLAELLGEPALTSDRKARHLRLAASAQRQTALLTADERQVLDSYTAGVNAAIDRFGSSIAPEVWLLGVPPERWLPEDSLAIGLLLQLQLSWAMGEELQRAQQLARLGRERAVDLWGWSPAEARAWIPPVASLGHPAREHEPITPPVGGFGSNAWAVAAQRSASGRPLLANDPHLGLSMPGAFYAVHLEGLRMAVAGASIPGTPGVVIGHTGGVAWGFALAMLDDQDLYVLTLDELGTRELVDGRWQLMRTVTENIVVRWQRDPVLVKVRLSAHGPVVREQRDETLALAWTGLQGPSIMRAVLGMNRAQTAAEVAAAWAPVVGPALSLVAADTGGDILHQVVGRAPLRGSGAGRLPSPGADSSWAWRGFRPMSANPRRANPEEGFVVAANHDLFTEGDFPADRAFPGEFAPPWRARRIRQVLGLRRDWTVDACLALQSDLSSGRAMALLRQLRPELEPAAGPAVRELLSWDARMEAGSVAAALFSELVSGLERAVGGDEAERFSLPANPIGPEELLRLLAGGMDDDWWDDLRRPGRQTREEILAEVIAGLDREPLDRSWGELHQVRFVHPLPSLPGVGRLLANTWNRGPYPVGGDNVTVNAQYWSRYRPFRVNAIPAMRFVVEVGSWDETRLGLPVGQSGRPWSGHYADQVGDWLAGSAASMPFSRAAVEHATKATLRLNPHRRGPRVPLVGE